MSSTGSTGGAPAPSVDVSRYSSPVEADNAAAANAAAEPTTTDTEAAQKAATNNAQPSATFERGSARGGPAVLSTDALPDPSAAEAEQAKGRAQDRSINAQVQTATLNAMRAALGGALNKINDLSSQLVKTEGLKDDALAAAQAKNAAISAQINQQATVVTNLYGTIDQYRASNQPSMKDSLVHLLEAAKAQNKEEEGGLGAAKKSKPMVTQEGIKAFSAEAQAQFAQFAEQQAANLVVGGKQSDKQFDNRKADAEGGSIGGSGGAGL